MLPRKLLKVMSVGNDPMKGLMAPVLASHAFFGNLTSRVYMASSAASRVHPTLTGSKTAIWHHPQLIGCQSLPRPAAKFHTSSVSSAEAVMQEVKKNPFFDKYKDKIKKTNEDVETVAQKIVEARQKFNEEDPEEVKFIREKLELLEEHQDVPVKLSKKNKPTLNDIVKLDLFDGKQPEEIQLIWLEFHKSHARNTISAIVPPPALKAMTRRAAENPQFLYALPRGQGIEFVLGQWSGNDCYFTPLVTYQTYQENAPVALTIHHFTDLADTKDLVLMRGEYDPNLFTPVEAQFLAMQLQLYYGEKVKPSKEKLLYRFNHRPSEFQHMDLVAELDTI